MRRAGLSQVAQGADSGSPACSGLMNKTFQKIEIDLQSRGSAARTPAVRPSFNMIFGYPGRGRKQNAANRIKLIMDICRRYPGAEFWTNIFTPYPGCARHGARL